MFGTNKIQKEIDKNKQKEIAKLNEVMLDKFVRFQIDNNTRAFIANAGSNDFIVNLIMQFASLQWRPMEEKEREELQKALAKASGIIIADKNDIPKELPKN